MGRNPDTDRGDKLTINALTPRHRGIARAMVAFSLTPRQLAERFSLSESHMTTITNSPLFKAELSRLERLADRNAIDAGRELEDMHARCLEVIAEDLYSPEKSTHRTGVAFNVLDRTGYHRGGEGGKGDDNRQINIYNFTPSPGDDPKEWEGHLKRLREKLKEDSNE